MSRYKNMKSGLKRQDFLFSDGWIDSRIKPPGSMHNQQFQMSDCQNSELFIFDTSACVYIDRCKHCTIFVGPCEGSIFLRASTQCVIVGVCKQFRVRDCLECIVALHCESQPVIESSHALYFDCFPNWGYPALVSQMKSIKLSVWNNNWWDIHDFTKNPTKQNFKIQKFDQNKHLNKSLFLSALKKSEMQFVSDIIPHTEGVSSLKNQQISILVYNSITPPSIQVTRLQLKVLQTQSLIPDQNLNQILKLEAQKQYIFVKLFASDTDQFEKINKEKGIRNIKKLDDVNEELNTMIFVPFKDEH